jgi:hypothetical protein
MWDVSRPFLCSHLAPQPNHSSKDCGEKVAFELRVRAFSLFFGILSKKQECTNKGDVQFHLVCKPQHMQFLGFFLGGNINVLFNGQVFLTLNHRYVCVLSSLSQTPMTLSLEESKSCGISYQLLYSDQQPPPFGRWECGLDLHAWDLQTWSTSSLLNS